MNSARTRFLWLTRLRNIIGNQWCGSDLKSASLQSIGNLCFQRVHNLASHDRMDGGSSTSLTLLQRDLDTLVSARTLDSKKDIVSFLAKAKKLLATSESFLSKEQLLSLLERVSQLGPSLDTDQIKVRGVVSKSRKYNELLGMESAILDCNVLSAYIHCKVLSYLRHLQDPGSLCSCLSTRRQRSKTVTET